MVRLVVGSVPHGGPIEFSPSQYSITGVIKHVVCAYKNYLLLIVV